MNFQKLLLWVLFFLPAPCFSQDLKINGAEEVRLKRVMEHIETHGDTMDVHFVKNKLNEISRDIPDPYKLMRSYATLRSGKFNQFDTLLKKTHSKLEFEIIQREARRQLNSWNYMVENNPDLTNELELLYPTVKSTIDYWVKQVENEIAKRRDDVIPPPPPDNDDSKENARLKRLLLLKDEYQSPELLDQISCFTVRLMDSLVDKSQGNLPYHVIFRRAGLHGRDLIVSVEPAIERDEHYYAKGEYASPRIDNIFTTFSETFFAFVDTNCIITASVFGQSDGIRILSTTKHKYEHKYDEWGDIQESTKDGKEFNLTLGDKLTNESLAFLRAYNVKRIFEKVVCPSSKCVKHISIETESKEDEIGTYRNARLNVYIFNYFTPNFEELLDNPLVGIETNLDQTITLEAGYLDGKIRNDGEVTCD